MVRAPPGDDEQIRRASGSRAAIVERFDRSRRFDEFNSPTYYGVDLYALALWRTFPPTQRSPPTAIRLEPAIWHEAAAVPSRRAGQLLRPYAVVRS